MEPTTTTASDDETSVMKAILVHEFTSTYETLDSISMSSFVPRPNLSKNSKKSKDTMIIRVLACSLSPGDCMMLSGRAIFMHPPKFPYIPGMDVCGVVEDVLPESAAEFKKGDVVVANNGIFPVGGLAEYMCVQSSNAVPKPENVSPIDAAAAASAVTALHAVHYVHPGDRVLILGGSGGVGTAAIQLARRAGASFVATTSTQKELCTNLGADVVINYREQDWWTIQDYQDVKFDKIIDTVGGGFANSPNVLKMGKEGGYFVAVTGDDPKPDVSSWLKVIRFLAILPIRPIYTWLFKGSYPTYVAVFPQDVTNGLRTVLGLVDEGKLKIQQDPLSPFHFGEDGVRQAFRTVGTSHAHGKCTVLVSEK